MTSLSPAQCAERLRLRIMPWFGWLPTDERPLRGRARESGFRIWRKSFWRHGGETEAVGRFDTTSGITRIDIRLGMRREDILFLLFWVVALTAELLLARWDAAGRGALLSMLFFGVVLMAGLRWESRGDGQFLVQLLRDTLDARDETFQPLH